jgi:AcrR family transcriptional regulator
MPKINASPVAGHRAQQREALIGAAIDILVNEGAAAVTPAAVGARAGLTRSSVYQYFDSSAAPLATITEDAFRRSNAALNRAMAAANGPVERVEAFVRESLRLAAEGAHRPAVAHTDAGLHPACQKRLLELHLEQVEPFRAAVRQLGAPSPRSRRIRSPGRCTRPLPPSTAVLRSIRHGAHARPRAPLPHSARQHGPGTGGGSLNVPHCAGG